MFRYYFRKQFLCVLLFLLVFVLVKHNHEDLVHKFVAISGKYVTKNVVNGNKLTSNHTSTLTRKLTSTVTGKLTSGKPPSRFFVFSPQCKIPYINPFSPTFLRWKTFKFKACANEPDLVSVIYDSDLRQYKLHLNSEVALKSFANYLSYGCTYQQVCPGSSDLVAYLRAPVYFDQDWIVPTDFMGVIVECHEIVNKSRILQRDAFSFVQYPRNRRESNDIKRAAKYPSVFLFGIDSISRMNFHRSMPLTSKFVSQDGWYEMEGYNKVADNTLPNLLAVLTGRTPKQWWSTCDVRKQGCLDNLTFLWNHFHSAGYLTAYAEDLASVSTFNYLKMGFTRRPVDYYLRPFLMVIEQVMKTVKYFGFEFCVGRRHSFSYVFDFAKQLIERFVFEARKPVFGLFWTNSFTHDDFRGATNLDELFVRYFEEFQEYRLFERSIVILLSDHGARYGPLAQHYTGFLEERLPMLHIYLPPWYRERYPRVARALRLNRNRLSSNYDLYLGIREVIQNIHPRMDFMQTFPSKKIRSILKVLPMNRTCSEAGIPEHWCTCKPFIDVPETELTMALTRITVFRINKFLKILNLDKDCHLLKLSEVLRAAQQLHFDESGNIVAAPDDLDTFSLVFTTQPNGGKFRSIIQSNSDHSIVHIEIDMISRLNAYVNQSYCVQDAVAKKFCLCRKDAFLRLQKGGITRIGKVKYEFAVEHEDDYYEETLDDNLTDLINHFH